MIKYILIGCGVVWLAMNGLSLTSADKAPSKSEENRKIFAEFAARRQSIAYAAIDQSATLCIKAWFKKDVPPVFSKILAESTKSNLTGQKLIGWKETMSNEDNAARAKKIEKLEPEFMMLGPEYAGDFQRLMVSLKTNGAKYHACVIDDAMKTLIKSRHLTTSTS